MLSMEPWAAAKKKFQPKWRSHQLLFGFLAKGHLSQVPRQSRISANNKGDNEIIQGTVQKSPGIYLAANKSLGKPQLGDRQMKSVRSVIASNGAHYLLMRSTVSYSMSRKEFFPN